MRTTGLFGVVLLIPLSFSIARLEAEETRPPLTLEQLESIALQPAKHYEETNSRVVPEMLPLFKEESITYTGKNRYKDATLRFRLHTPETMEPGKKYPLILWLHGVGEAGDDNRAQLIHLHHVITYLTGPKKRDFFLLVPQTPKDHTGWDAYTRFQTRLVPKKAENGDNDQKKNDDDKQVEGESWLGNMVGVVLRKTETTRTLPDGKEVTVVVTEVGEAFEDSPLGFSFAMLDSVVEKYPVDTDRITVSGLSSGGDGTWRALERRPGQFAAAVPLVSWNALKEHAIDNHPELKKVPVWAIYSSDDNGIEFARKEFERIEKAGCNVKKSEFGVCGHNAWTPAMLQADIFSWLLSRGRKDGEYVAVVDANVDPDDMKGIVDVATRDSRTPTLTIVEESKAAPVKDAEMRPATLVTSERGSGPPEPPPAVARMSKPLVVTTPTAPAKKGPNAQEIEELRAQLAFKYFLTKNTAGFERIAAKLSTDRKMKLISAVLAGPVVPPLLETVERMIEEIEGIEEAASQKPEPAVSPRPSRRIEDEIPGAKIIEECDRPWAMTSDSLYGMFPADWTKEAKEIPDFVVNSTIEELQKILLESTRTDGSKIKAACQSILALENRPMSSPWFETSGGRLKGDISYSLSAKGKVLVRLLQSNKGDRICQKTLEKIDWILGENRN